MLDYFMKIFKVSRKGGVEDTTPVFSHGPQLKRENRLHRSIWFYRGALLLIGACYFITVLFYVTKEPVKIVVDAETGEVIGEYRTTAYKTREEVLGGMKKFLEYYLSFNSQTVYDDHARAINMMNDELSRERVEYLKKTNLTFEIYNANSTSQLDFTKAVIKQIKDDFAVVDLAGDIVIYTHGTQPKNQPFHFVIKAKMVTLKGNNTIGLEISEIFEYD